MDKDIDVHDSRSTEEPVASYSYSACVGSTAWDWSHRQIQFELWTKHMLFSTLAACMYRFPTIIHHWCCSTTGALTEATCIPLSEQTDWPWQLINFCTMLVLSNQNVKNQILLSMQYGITHITLTRQGVGSGQALTPPLSQTHHHFCAEDVAGPWKADFVWCYACQTFYGQ